MTPASHSLAALALLGFASAALAAGDHGHGHGHGHAEAAKAGHGAAGHDDHGHAHRDEAAAGDDHVAVAGFGLRATHPWTNATEGREALVFVELENHGAAPVSLTGARSPAAAEAMLVGFRLKNGAPAYAPLGAMTLDAEGDVTLAPFGLAIRLTGLVEPLHEGESVPLTLLTDLGELEMVVAVEASDATQHSHAGHAHD